LGASGRTGSRLTLLALEKGIYVVAFVRDQKKFYRVIGRQLSDEEAKLLTVIEGDTTSSVDVEKALTEVDVVYETVGKNPGPSLSLDSQSSVGLSLGGGV
jgi:putative NADH-flavin reductase